MGDTPLIVVIGLGPAGPDMVTAGSLAAIRDVPVRFLRTSHHPAAGVLGTRTPSFDNVYEASDDLGDVYPEIVDALVAAATEAGKVLYAVPGSPVVAERTVALLLSDERVRVELQPALSFADLAWTRLGIDPVASGARVIDAYEAPELLPRSDGPVLIAQCHDRMLLSEIKLAVDPPPGGAAIVLQRLGLPDEAILEVPWDDLDRAIAPDHLTSVWVPWSHRSAPTAMAAFAPFVSRLRSGCPWDAEQTHASLRPHLLEEAHEVLAALDDLAALEARVEAGAAIDEATEAAAFTDLEEELGDLFFQIVLHSELAAEIGAFDLADVIRGIHRKLYRRHPHVRDRGPVPEGESEAEPTGAPSVTTDELVVTWEASKRREKNRDSILDGLPHSLPALARAQKLQRKAAAVGFDWDTEGGAWAKVAEELDELRWDRSADEFGDLLLALAVLGNRLGLEAEGALRSACNKFEQQFRMVERRAEELGLDLGKEPESRLVGLWEDAKAELADPGAEPG